VGSPFREFDFGDEIWTYPNRSPRDELIRLEWDLVDQARLHFRQQIAQDLLRKARADVTAVDELAAFVEAERERSECVALAWRVAADDEFLLLCDLELDPGAAAARFV